ncbi:MAG TPA: hypothetical protein VF297_10190 [Pyrinomonadaceae bacterium]
MERVSSTSSVYRCENNERVTFTFDASNTDILITYRIGTGASQVVEGDGFSFTPEGQRTTLRVFFNYNGSGGSYGVSLRGSAGGNFPDPPRVRQAHDLVPTRRYVFTH